MLCCAVSVVADQRTSRGTVGGVQGAQAESLHAEAEVDDGLLTLRNTRLKQAASTYDVDGEYRLWAPTPAAAAAAAAPPPPPQQPAAAAAGAAAPGAAPIAAGAGGGSRDGADRDWLAAARPQDAVSGLADAAAARSSLGGDLQQRAGEHAGLADAGARAAAAALEEIAPVDNAPVWAAEPQHTAQAASLAEQPRPVLALGTVQGGIGALENTGGVAERATGGACDRGSDAGCCAAASEPGPAEAVALDDAVSATAAEIALRQGGASVGLAEAGVHILGELRGEDAAGAARAGEGVVTVGAQLDVDSERVWAEHEAGAAMEEKATERDGAVLAVTGDAGDAAAAGDSAAVGGDEHEEAGAAVQPLAAADTAVAAEQAPPQSYAAVQGGVGSVSAVEGDAAAHTARTAQAEDAAAKRSGGAVAVDRLPEGDPFVGGVADAAEATWWLRVRADAQLQDIVPTVETLRRRSTRSAPAAAAPQGVGLSGRDRAVDDVLGIQVRLLTLAHRHAALSLSLRLPRLCLWQRRSCGRPVGTHGRAGGW